MDSNEQEFNVREALERQEKMLAQALRENASFQHQVRQGMLRDLEILKEQQRGEQFTPLLKEISAVCVEYRSILNEEAIPENARRTLHLLFDQLEDILADYGAELFISQIGEARNPLLTKVINTIANGDESKHNTIARSRRAGVVRNGHPLYREFVDVFVYNEELNSPKNEE